MRVNKTTVTLKADEILRLFYLLVPINSDTTKVDFLEYQKALKLLQKLKDQLYIEVKGEKNE